MTTAKKCEDYYQDPELKKTQRENLSRTVTCICGTKCSQTYIYQHRKKKICQKRLENLGKITTLEEKKESIAKHIAKLEEQMDGLDKSIMRIKNKNDK